MKHTPGPWRFDGHGINGNDGTRIAKVSNTNPHQGDGRTRDTEFDATSRLIAAAPELLEALKEVVAISDRKHDAWDKARAAIAKAEGTNG
jgi:hypothetical protein